MSVRHEYLETFSNETNKTKIKINSSFFFYKKLNEWLYFLAYNATSVYSQLFSLIKIYMHKPSYNGVQL